MQIPGSRTHPNSHPQTGTRRIPSRISAHHERSRKRKPPWQGGSRQSPKQNKYRETQSRRGAERELRGRDAKYHGHQCRQYAFECTRPLPKPDHIRFRQYRTLLFLLFQAQPHQHPTYHPTNHSHRGQPTGHEVNPHSRTATPRTTPRGQDSPHIPRPTH
jgi:hypothetical protein